MIRINEVIPSVIIEVPMEFQSEDSVFKLKKKNQRNEVTFGEKQVGSALMGLGETCSALCWLSSPCDVPMALFLCLGTALWMRKTFESSSVQPTMMVSTRDVIMNGFHSTVTLPPTASSGVRHGDKTLSWMGLGAPLAPWTCVSVASAR